MPPVFAHGALRLYLLALLEEGPKHGYDVIRDLSGRFGGTYSPSAGTVYPRLAKLEEEGLVATTTDGRRTIYSLTDAGLAELESRRGELQEVEHDISSSVRRLADELRGDIRANMKGLRADLAATAEAARGASRRMPDSGSQSPANHRLLKETEMMLQSFRDDLRVELRAHAGRQQLTELTVETVRTVLDQAQIAIRATLKR
ncbi:MAG: PadR family transcriptional regulator [Actinomycetota bacterium]|uniref:PadR family transcriptional regulator n=1 Tax=Paenarthrobacter sp. PH39-S1 TaxID=3046204 RepID=UPI0024BA08C9|nr:PadR family transcriptional regulator [Paenarthrobacter sp. PH39-S1]MDJ0358367.1 PadR family transcriptional regulator [Paenarthrobacter sp. PH39-S1]MDQ6738968.1 PadR family transcriptional regulator [Actinomycetota bacterium]